MTRLACLLCLLQTFVLPPTVAVAQGVPAIGPVGAIRGSVWDADGGVPLAQVRVTVVEAFVSTQTGPEGSFLFERVPPGSYTLSFTLPGYEREVVGDVRVSEGELRSLEVNLRIEVIEMDEFVVTGGDLLGDTELGLIEVRQEAIVVQDAISKDMIGKAGATEVSGALPLVVGASVSQGKYATVRGLSDRYTGTTLNGVRVPSADPRRRAVQLDLFPTGTVESVTVTKTFTPDLQGDFTGGGVDIKTKSIPDELVLSASLSIEHNSLATSESDSLTYDGGGVFASDRDLPSEGYAQNLQTFPAGTPPPWINLNPTPTQKGYSEDWDRLTRAFSSTMGVTEESPPANQSFSLTGGQSWNFGANDVLGVLGSVTYKRSHEFYGDAVNNAVSIGEAGSEPLVLSRADTRGTDELLTGFLLNVVWQPSPSHELGLKAIYNHSREDHARFQEQQLTTQVEQNQSLQYIERDVFSPQLHGRHSLDEAIAGEIFSDIEVDWNVAANSTSQDEPDVRFFRNLYTPESATFSFPVGSAPDTSRTLRVFRKLEEANDQAAANVALPFASWSEAEGRVKAGLYAERSDRDYFQRSYSYNGVGQRNAPGPINWAWVCNLTTIQLQAPAESSDQLWTDFFLDSDRIGLAPRIPTCPQNLGPMNQTPAPNQLLWVLVPKNSDVNYEGASEIDAWYAMAELPVTSRLQLVAGARHERTEMSVVPSNVLNKVEVIVTLPDGTFGVDPGVKPEDATAEIEESSWLPSLSASYELLPGMQLRAAWSHTIARPTFRELAPVATAEYIDGDEFVGNPELELSDIENYDLRWEWFRRSGELFAASVFYKELTDPIEYISFSATGRAFIQPVNFEAGELGGFELELRVPFDPYVSALGGLVFGANYTSLDSATDVPLYLQQSLADFGLAEEERRLQGQPESLFNVNLSYDSDRWGLSGGLFLNRVGDTLQTGAARGADTGAVPNVFEKAITRLDMTVTKTLFEQFAVTLKLKNLTTPDRESVYRLPDGSEIVKFSQETPLLVSLGAGWTW